MAIVTIWLIAAGCDPRQHDGSQAQPCARAVAAFPPVDSDGGLRAGLEGYLTQYADGWSIGNGADGLVVTLPPGCADLANRIESHYGSAIRVERDVRIQPLR